MINYQQLPQQQPSRKRSRVESFATNSYDFAGIQQLQAHASGSVAVDLTSNESQAQYQVDGLNYQYQFPRPASEQAQGTQSPYTHSTQPQHHHHRLPNQPPPSKTPRTTYGESAATQDHGPPSVVGQPGMPVPAPRPKGPKLKFTPEDDALLVELKETKDLTWKQIADFFPGRSSGTLQVRYCTKLKAKTTVWTDEMVREDDAATDAESSHQQ